MVAQLILLLEDILQELPTASDWDEVYDAASHNEVIRTRVNQHIAHIWAVKAKRDKKELKDQALSSKEAFQILLDIIHGLPGRPYNLQEDPKGFIKWTEIAKSITEQYPLSLYAPTSIDLITVYDIVKKIIAQFKQLIENNRLWKSLYYKGDALRENYSQRLFFAVSYSYCKVNNLDIFPEVDSGTGNVDFKFSKGFNSRVLVKVKLSTNNNLAKLLLKPTRLKIAFLAELRYAGC